VGGLNRCGHVFQGDTLLAIGAPVHGHHYGAHLLQQCRQASWRVKLGLYRALLAGAFLVGRRQAADVICFPSTIRRAFGVGEHDHNNGPPQSSKRLAMTMAGVPPLGRIMLQFIIPDVALDIAVLGCLRQRLPSSTRLCSG
jgi:hypothetical protein